MQNPPSAITGPESAADGAVACGRADGPGRFVAVRVVVTGGGRGIGRQIALAFAAAGASVAVLSRSAAEVRGTADEIAGHDVPALPLPCDVRDGAQLAAARDTVLSVFGGVDVLVNAAGIFTMGPSADFSEQAARDLLETNALGTFLACQTFGAPMLDQGSGKIVNLASLLSFTAFPQRAVYAASKGAVLQLTRALGVEWAPCGLQVNAVAPGMIDNSTVHPAVAAGQLDNDGIVRRIPAGRRGRPDDVVGSVLFLASPSADYICGQTLVVDGGWLSYGYV